MAMRRVVSVVVVVFLVGSLMVGGVSGADADDVAQCYVIGDTSGNQSSELLGTVLP